MQLLQCLSLGLNYWLMQSLSWRWLYLELVYDLCGGDIAYYMMEYSYIVDITQEHDRWTIFCNPYSAFIRASNGPSVFTITEIQSQSI